MHSHYLICYDVETRWVRYRVDKLLSGYGERVQYSVFECAVSDSQFIRLRADLSDLLGDADKINYYKMCQHCLRRRLSQGAMIPWQAKAYELID